MRSQYLKVEVSVREPIIEPLATLPARTVLIDPFRKAAAVKPFAARVPPFWPAAWRSSATSPRRLRLNFAMIGVP